MITILEDGISAVIDTFAEMKTVLEDGSGDYKGIIVVYMNMDMNQTATAITVPLSKPEVVIDGTYNGQRHTYSTLGDSSSNFITSANPGTAKQAMHITMQHMNISGSNYYGAMGSPDNSNYVNVTFTYHDVDYSGAQTSYHRYGVVEYIDCRIDVNRNEVAECRGVILGGTTTINHSVASYATFWMYYNAGEQFCRVREKADITITASYAAIYNQNGAQFIIEDGASLIIEAPLGIAYDAHTFASFTVGRGANLQCTQTVNTYACIYIAGTMDIAPDATVYLKKTTGALPILNLSSSQLNITSPRSFILDSSTGNAVLFTGTTHLNLQGGQLNYWAAAPSSSDPGGFSDIPSYSWRKTAQADQSVAETYIRGNAVTASFTLDAEGTNLTAEELDGKALSNLRLNNAYLFAIGSLPLWVNPIADDGWPVFGTTAASAKLRLSYSEQSLDGLADSEGTFSIDTPAPLPFASEVSVTANLPYLLSSGRFTVVEPGEIALIETPAQIAFRFDKKLLLQHIYGRELDDWSLQVLDSRARSTPWSLSVTADGHLSSYDGETVKHTLPEALIFVDAQGQEHSIGSDPVLIWQDEANGGDLSRTVTISWDADKGPLMKRSTQPVWVGELYSASLNWLIETEPI